ncbi:MAG: hypothetical protein VKP72_02575 [bacterium]|nr:hypothetical protein [bacterium]
MSIRNSLVRAMAPTPARQMVRTTIQEAGERAAVAAGKQVASPIARSSGDRFVRSAMQEVQPENFKGVARFIDHVRHEIEYRNLIHNSAVIPPRQALDRFSQGTTVQSFSRLMGAVDPTAQAVAKVSGAITRTAPYIPVLYPWYPVNNTIQRVAGQVNRLKDPETLRTAVVNFKELMMPLL